MVAKELIYNFREVLKETQSSVSERTDQHLMYLLDEARVILASRKIQNNYDVTNFTQFFDVKPVKAESAIISKVGSKPVLVVNLPTMFASFNNLFGGFSVGSTDGETSYSKIAFHSIKTSIYRKYTGSSPKWALDDNKILIINSTTGVGSKVRVRGIFDEPGKISAYRNIVSKLDPYQYEYPLSMKDAAALYNIAMSGELSYGDVAAQAVSKQQRANQRAQMDAQASRQDSNA
jgi:hypothetical protein